MKPRILLYADFRSPHALGWKEGLAAAGFEVLGVASESVDHPGIASPGDFVSRRRQQYVDRSRTPTKAASGLRRKIAAIQPVHSAVQVVRSSARIAHLRDQFAAFAPDVVHALRLPYEGVTALSAQLQAPLVVSSWGQDFVPQAVHDPLLRNWLRRYLPSAAGFHYDANPDLERARRYGLPRQVPSLHAAGNFGVDESLFHDRDPKETGLVVYARKATPNCNYFGFIEAALTLIPRTEAVFVGVGLTQLKPDIVRRYGAYDENRLKLVGELERKAFARLIRRSQVVVSPSYADGMPNTVLEALASGARVVAGDLPQLRDLKSLGLSITLVDPKRSSEIGNGIFAALCSEPPSLVELPLEYSREVNKQRVSEFYRTVLGNAW